SNARVVVPLVALQSLIYMTLNHRSLEGSTETPAMLLDGVLGFHAWTVWAYVALIATPIMMALMIRSRDIFRRAIVAYVVAMSASRLACAFDNCWPGWRGSANSRARSRRPTKRRPRMLVPPYIGRNAD